MSQFVKRIADLPSRRRLLLERMLRRRGREDLLREPADIVELPSGSPAEVTRSTRRFYDSVNHQLSASEFGPFSFFLNFGYVSDASPEAAVVNLPLSFLNRNSAKLVLELVEDCPIKGRAILDVGCGRGGALYVLNRFLGGDDLTGIDLSSGAISFCRRMHTAAAFHFLEGNAEQLPFPQGAFDIVINVESSHSYPHRLDFYREVLRVLRLGGRLLYSDLLPIAQFTHAIRYLTELGFEVERNRDISNNVLLSCEEVGRRRLAAFGAGNDSGIMREFLGAPESLTYGEMRRGLSQYRIVWAKKSET
jgi:phthiocerol/phenolphthiocerol synthesis type-I polyketide synthase E